MSKTTDEPTYMGDGMWVGTTSSGVQWVLQIERYDHRGRAVWDVQADANKETRDAMTDEQREAMSDEAYKAVCSACPYAFQVEYEY